MLNHYEIFKIRIDRMKWDDSSLPKWDFWFDIPHLSSLFKTPVG
jgi:hypothetical protein